LTVVKAKSRSVRLGATVTSTGRLNAALAEWVRRYPPPVRGRNFRIRYASQVSSDPVRFVFIVNRLEGFPQAYAQYLENRIRAELGRYLSAEVVDGIVRHTLDLQLGGERREVTILFLDLQGFTAMSEKLDPEDVQLIIDNYMIWIPSSAFLSQVMRTERFVCPIRLVSTCIRHLSSMAG
jgi:hypothetical protein